MLTWWEIPSINGMDEPFDFHLMLSSRVNQPEREAWRFKLLPDGLIGFDTKEVSVDVKKMTATGIISTPRLDCSREIVMGEGIDTSLHQRIPLVLLMHKKEIPVGRAEDRNTLAYTVNVTPERTTATTNFFQNSLESEQCFRAVECGALPGMSIGVRDKPGRVKSYIDKDRMPYGVIEACWLMEYSHVVFPDNYDALVRVVQKGLGGKPLVESLRQLFVPMLPPPKIWSPGASLMETPLITKAIDVLNEKGIDWVKQQIEKSGLQECVSRKIPIIANDHPEMKEDQRIAVAYSMCGEGKGLQDQGDMDRGEDNRPFGGQFYAGLHEMGMAMHEFIEENKNRLEPEVMDGMEKFYEHHHGMMEHVRMRYKERYPNLYPLGDTTRPPDDEAQKVETKKLSELTQERCKEWWERRMNRLSNTDLAKTEKVADFLEQIAKQGGHLTTNQKKIAAEHVKEIRQMCRDIEVPKQAPEPEIDLSAALELLKKRNETLGEMNNGLSKVMGK